MDVTSHIPSIPNFRPLGNRLRKTCTTDSDSNRNSDTGISGVRLYRSSSPDFIEQSDMKNFRKLGIKSIIDLRSVMDYNLPPIVIGRPSEKLLDGRDFDIYSVDYGLKSLSVNYKAHEPVATTKLPLTEANTSSSPFAAGVSNEKGKHFLINFFTTGYFFRVIRKSLSVSLQLWLILQIIVHFVANSVFETWTYYHKFLCCFIGNVANKQSLVDTTIDTLEYGSVGICAALKLLTNKENLPSLIVCRYGKDRTGLVAALVLSCLGETTENILKDYAQSEDGLKPIFECVYEDMAERLMLKEEYLTAKPETMSRVLKYLDDNYGSVQDYLVHIGFSLEEQEMLRQNILGQH